MSEGVVVDINSFLLTRQLNKTINNEQNMVNTHGGVSAARACNRAAGLVQFDLNLFVASMDALYKELNNGDERGLEVVDKNVATCLLLLSYQENLEDAKLEAALVKLRATS